jgi:hypothetical protein
MMHVCGKGHNLISKVNTIKNLKIVTREKFIMLDLMFTTLNLLRHELLLKSHFYFIRLKAQKLFRMAL